MTKLNRKTCIKFDSDPSLHTIDYLKGIIEDASLLTLFYTREITPEELHWQYAENWNTVGALLSHIVATRHYFRIIFVEDRDFVGDEKSKIVPGLEMGKHLPDLMTNDPLSFYVQQLEESKAMLLQSIDQLSPSDFYKKREGYNPETGHNLAWTLYHLAEDEVHHRGQISIIRKLYKTIH